LHSSLHVPWMLSSPPSSSLMSRISSKLCATQARELSRDLGDGMSGKWGERGTKGEVGKRGKFWGKKGGWKIPR
jgi:hypothetical protein